MKKLTSVVLSVLLVVSLFSCLLTGPVSAAASSGELITNGDFESEANTSTGALGCLAWVKIADFNANRAAYAGKWYRATGGNEPSKAPDLSENKTTPGTNDYPYYFGRNDQRVAEPGNAGNHVMRAVQTLYQMVSVKENSSYSLSFRFKVPRAAATLDQKMMIGLLEPDVLNGTQISNINSPALPITSATVSGTDGVSTYIIPDTFAGSKGNIQLSFDGSNSEWQNVTLNFTTGSFYSDALAEEYGDEHLIVLNFSWSVTDTNTIYGFNYTKAGTYFDDISLKETIDCVAAAEFYNKDGKIATPNDYAAVSLQVGGQPALKAFAGEQATATVNYDKESGAYRFLGWYKNGVKVSAEESITFTAAAGEVYTPRFGSANILSSSASFEGTAPGGVNVETNTTFPHDNRWGSNKNAGYYGATYAETIYDKNGTAYQQMAYGSASDSVAGGAVATVVNDKAHSGSKSVKLVFNYRTSSLALDVAKDTDYTLTYYWVGNSGNALKGSAITTTVNVGDQSTLTPAGTFSKTALANMTSPGKEDLPIVLKTATSAEVAASDGTTWRKVTLSFNSGSFEKLYLIVSPAVGNETVWIDDLVCTAQVDSAVPVTFENTAGATIDGSSEYASAEILDNFDGTSTATVDYDKTSGAYAFKGWYNGDQRVSTEESFVFSNSAYPTLTPVVVSRNLLSNAGSFEQYNATTDLTVTRRDSGLTTEKGGTVYTADPPTGDKWGAWTNFTYPAGGSGGSYCGENYMNVTALSGAYTMKYYTAQDKSTTATETVKAHTGDNMLRIGFHSRSSIRALENLTPHTDYTLSFYTWGADEWNYIKYVSVATDYKGLQTNATSPIAGSGCELLVQYIQPTEKINSYDCLPAALVRSWRKITLNFNSGNHTTLYLHLGMQSTSTDSAISASLIDDLTLVSHTSAAVVFENTAGETIEGSNEYAVAEILENADGTSTATVDYDKTSGAYTFKGWYQNSTLLSENEAFTFTTGAYDVLTAVITSKNILGSSASFENIANGTGMNVETNTTFPHDNLWGSNKNAGYYGATYEGTVYDKDGVAYEQTATGSAEAVNGAAVARASNEKAHSGTKSLKLSLQYRTASLALDVTPNTDYVLSYYWIGAADTALKNSAITTTLNVGRADSSLWKDILTYPLANQLSATSPIVKSIASADEIAASDGETWRKVTLSFNSGTLDKLYLVISPNANEIVWVDDIVCQATVPATFAVTDMKSCAAVEGVDCDLDNLFIGQNVQFKVINNMETIPVVKANDVTLICDENGVYSFRAAANNTLSVRFAGDEALNDYDKDYDRNDLSAYNEDVYLKSIWEGDTVYQESALFVTGRDTVKLLYPVSQMISLRSYDLKTNYVEDVDYEVTAEGAIRRLAGSRIPVYTGALTTATNNGYPLKDGTGYIGFIGDTTYPQYAVSVTYKHTATYEDGYTPAAPASQSRKLADTIAKLEAGQTVNIAIYGDSISCGWSSSGLNNTNVIYDSTNTEGNFKSYVINVAPYAPTWIDMFLSALQKRYPDATINLKNLSLGGMGSYWGRENIAARLALWKDEGGNQVTPDLLLVGFGVNDAAGNIPASTFKIYSQGIVDNARTASGNSDMEVLFYSPMLPNQKAVAWDQEKLMGYENALAAIAANDAKVGLLKLTSIFTEIVKSKDAVDYLNTNGNHGNDFTARVYATGILAALLVPAEPTLPDSITEYLGTAIRTTGTQALRFKFSISKDIVKYGIAGYDLVEYGSIAIRTEYLGGNALTKDGEYNYGAKDRKPVVGVAYNKDAGKNILFAETDTDYVFTAALTNIGVNKTTGETNYDAWGYDYSVRNYAVFKNTETGVLTTVYDETTAVSSVFGVMDFIEASYEAAGSPTEGELHDDYMAIQTILGETESEQRRAYAAWKAQ